MRNPPGIQAVDRALQLLQAFRAPEQELGVTELAAALGVHKSTVSRLAATLAGRGFLERAPGSDAFRLGPELGRLGLLALRRSDLVELARPAMERLADETGETVNLGVLEGSEAVNVAQAEGRHIVGVGSWAGRRTPLHCAANGKVLLAASGAAELPARLERFTERTIVERRALERDLDRVRRRGYATNVGELEEGLNAVAVPVRDAEGTCLAALSVSGPAYRLPEGTLAGVARACSQAAAEIEGLLGRGARAA
jgi:DNA-binding IclR family transcriptional regulator